MNPKKVWSIILIVLGVFAVIGGASSYQKLEVLGNSMVVFDASVVKTPDQSTTGAFGSSQVQGSLYREKVLSIIGLLIGISLSAIGTLMIKENRAKPVIEFENEFEIDADKEVSFKF